MQGSLTDLIEARRSFIASAEDNNFTSGLQRLLTDLYPDTAHFVYELLQNAEDADATSVEFDLSKEGVYFAHNGSRLFTLEDIDAITSIGGNLTKKDTPTAIGEFGVGFKAVFSYTTSPEIHSGDFHFCIHDFFVPDTESVRQTFIKHKEGASWTEFYFPFNNPKKPSEAAYRETLVGLERLDGTALLFLRNIKKIDCSAVDGTVLGRSLTRADLSNHVVEIRETDSRGGAEKTMRFLRFTREITIEGGRSKKKSLPIGVAYTLEKKGAGELFIIPDEKARTFIYFPADKERSNLKFHINAPFAATVARDSILDCEDNRSLMEQVASLVCESLLEIKTQGLLDISFYAVMPNDEDQLDGFYPIIRDKVLRAFKDNPYLVARGGGYLPAINALAGPRVFSEFLDAKMLDGFIETKKRWITNPMRNINRREEAFLRSLDIEEFTEKSFAEAFNSKRRRDWLIEFGKDRDDAWFKGLYLAMAQVQSTQANQRSSVGQVYSSHIGAEQSHDLFARIDWMPALDKCVDNMKRVALVKCDDGILRMPDESFFLPADFEAHDIPVALVSSVFVDGKTTRSYDPSAVRKFLEAIGVREYSLKVALEQLAEKYKTQVNPKDPSYYQDLMTMARGHKRNIDVDVSDQALFVADAPNGKMRLSKASDLVIGDEYGNYLGNEVARFSKMGTLGRVYKAFYTEKRGYTSDDLNDFLDWAKSCGANMSLGIVECDIEDNYRYHELLTQVKRRSPQMTSADYTIRGLPASLKGISHEMSFEIWQLLSENGSTPKYAEACIWPGPRSKAISGESTLIHHLKSHAWIPNVEGTMCKPGEVAYRDLSSQFQNVAKGALIEALELGSEISGRKQAERKLEADAKRLDKHVVSTEDFELLQSFKERERKAAERQAAKESKRSAQQVFSSQDKEGKPQRDESEFETGTVNNPRRRATNIADTIRDSQALPVQRRAAYSTVYASSKEEKENLEQWYHGRCQICGTTIPHSNGSRYFEAINIIDTRALPDRMRGSMSLGWNSLCLCPNCAAKYRYSSKRISDLPEQIAQKEVIAGGSETIKLSIELAGRTVEIGFVPKHFIALQEGVKALDAS